VCVCACVCACCRLPHASWRINDERYPFWEGGLNYQHVKPGSVSDTDGHTQTHYLTLQTLELTKRGFQMRRMTPRAVSARPHPPSSQYQRSTSPGTRMCCPAPRHAPRPCSARGSVSAWASPPYPPRRAWQILLASSKVAAQLKKQRMNTRWMPLILADIARCVT